MRDQRRRRTGTGLHWQRRRRARWGSRAEPFRSTLGKTPLTRLPHDPCVTVSILTPRNEGFGTTTCGAFTAVLMDQCTDDVDFPAARLRTCEGSIITEPILIFFKVADRHRSNSRLRHLCDSFAHGLLRRQHSNENAHFCRWFRTVSAPSADRTAVTQNPSCRKSGHFCDSSRTRRRRSRRAILRSRRRRPAGGCDG
jgi:hypothetical protein